MELEVNERELKPKTRMSLEVSKRLRVVGGVLGKSQKLELQMFRLRCGNMQVFLKILKLYFHYQLCH